MLIGLLLVLVVEIFYTTSDELFKATQDDIMQMIERETILYNARIKSLKEFGERLKLL